MDTPGVGENVQDSEIVRNYIAKNNVFGFIFTIHTSAGSGVNLKVIARVSLMLDVINVRQ